MQHIMIRHTIHVTVVLHCSVVLLDAEASLMAMTVVVFLLLHVLLFVFPTALKFRN